MNVENTIRKTSLIYHYGIGGLWTNNSDETFIIRSVKYWEWKSGNGDCGIINEDHLRDHLKVKKIIFPPGAKDKQIPLIEGSIGVGRFPGWHRCKGWRTKPDGKKEPCGAMYQLEQNQGLSLCTMPECSGNKKSLLAPVRFMLICSNGHLDDFPFHYWVHRKKGGEDHKLRYINRSGSGLSGIFIQCETCSSAVEKVERNMQGALTPDSFDDLSCTGRMPWKGDEYEKCIKPDPKDSTEEEIILVGVQKSSSNLLFPVVKNAIFCPTYDSLPAWIKNQLDSNDRKKQIRDLMELDFGGVPDKFDHVLSILFSSLLEDKLKELISKKNEILDYLNPKPTDDPFKDNGYLGILQREYDRFLFFPSDQRLDDLTLERPDMNSYPIAISSWVDQVVLIDKLRDTRAYLGFTRVEPRNSQISDQEIIQKCYGTNEVVGDIVRGEGIFLKFNEEELLKWAKRSDVSQRVDVLSSVKSEELLTKESINTKDQGAIYMFIHSFSHALISAVSGLAGYNIASIRERIYVGEDGKNGRMYGLLIYTADGDSEGSLGGLVRLGRPEALTKIVDHAIRSCNWCSSDPLCSHSVPKGSGGGVLAACHHCILLPETSCQDKNEFLDREMVKSLDNTNLGFFK